MLSSLQSNKINSANSNTNCQPYADLVLIRGIPGSGKSTMAAVLAAIGFDHFEADMYFDQNGVYQYDPRKVAMAHVWCQQQTADALNRGRKVVVSNTFTKLVELAPYMSMSKSVKVLEASGRWENCHGVPEARVTEMLRRWEKLPDSFSHHNSIGRGALRGAQTPFHTQ